MRENHQKHRPNGAAAEGGRPIGAPPKAAPVFLIYGVNSESGHDRSQSFGSIWHVSGPEIVF